jgi:ribosome biogenesis protein YTM1
LLGGEFVRSSLRQHLAARQLTAEAVHQVEYIEAIPAPAPLSDFEHDDWVSSVHAAAPGVFLTASYDRHVRVWSAVDKSLIIDIPDAHAGIVKCVRWISFVANGADNTAGDATATNTSSAEPPQSGVFVSSGDDNVIKVWECSPADGTYRALYQFEGHSGAVDRVCVEPSRSKLCSASWDGEMRIWDLEMAASVAASNSSVPSGKRRRTAGAGGKRDAEDDDDAVVDADALNTCIAVLSGHQGRVSSAVWPTFDRIYSGGWDNSVRAWDAETSKCVTTLTGPVPVHDISYSMPTGLVATAHSDRVGARVGSAHDVDDHSEDADVAQAVGVVGAVASVLEQFAAVGVVRQHGEDVGHPQLDSAVHHCGARRQGAVRGLVRRRGVCVGRRRSQAVCARQPVG